MEGSIEMWSSNKHGVNSAFSYGFAPDLGYSNRITETQEAKTIIETPPSFLKEPRKEPAQQPTLDGGKRIPEG